MDSTNSDRLTVGRALLATLFLALAFGTWRFLLEGSFEPGFVLRVTGVLLSFSLIGAGVGCFVGRPVGYALVALGVGIFLVAWAYWSFPVQD